LAKSKILTVGFFFSVLFLNIVSASHIKYPVIKTGDIIFRKENSFLSNRFEKLDGRGYSHIGIIYIKEQQIYVLHIERNSEENDLKIVTLKTFLKDATKYKIKRLKKIYSEKSIETNIKKLIKSNPAFDLNFDLSTDNKLYCTELVYKLYLKSFHIKLTSKQHTFGYYHYISVGSILSSDQLKDIL